MNIYIIAGPPGIGKSTTSSKFIPTEVEIIDHDLAAYQYKKEGFTDYTDLGIMSGNQQIRDCLFSKTSFALELNLGFESHYEYLKSIATFDNTNKINLLMYFTDDISICTYRANIRFKNGGHLVKPEIIHEMYAATFPLLHKNIKLFHSIYFLDVTHEVITVVNKDSIPDWIKINNLEEYL